MTTAASGDDGTRRYAVFAAIAFAIGSHGCDTPQPLAAPNAFPTDEQQRDWDITEARFEYLRDMLRWPESITDERYAEGLSWLEAALVKLQTCSRFDLLVRWTRGRPEHDLAVWRALSGCWLEHLHAQWFEMLAERGGAMSGELACDAVVRGESKLRHLCIHDGMTRWKIDFARAIDGVLWETALRQAARAPDTTRFVVESFARLPGVSREEACAATYRAEAAQVQRALGIDRVSASAHWQGVRMVSCR
jgi:hypothetical protein